LLPGLPLAFGLKTVVETQAFDHADLVGSGSSDHNEIGAQVGALADETLGEDGAPPAGRGDKVVDRDRVQFVGAEIHRRFRRFDRRSSLLAMAKACFGEVTFFPPRPECSSPLPYSFMTLRPLGPSFAMVVTPQYRVGFGIFLPFFPAFFFPLAISDLLSFSCAV